MKKLVLGALAGAVVSVASAREWTVDVAGGGDYTCIQDAIDDAAAGDTVWVKPGVYQTLVYANCLLNMDEEAFASLDAANRPSSVRIASAAEAGYSDAGRPLSAKALGVDKVADTAFLAATDADGLPRISNGTMDLGAFEFDWRPIYAQDLGSVGTVVREDAPVVEKDGQVFLPQGALELVLADDAQRGRYRFPVQVTGTGHLTIRAGDETLATFDAADGAVAFRYRTRTAGNSLTFAYAPGDGDTGGALLAQASGGPGLIFVIR